MTGSVLIYSQEREVLTMEKLITIAHMMEAGYFDGMTMDEIDAQYTEADLWEILGADE